MKEKREIVYLKADRNSVCHDPKIKIQDVMSVQCADPAICAGIKNKTLYTFKKNDGQKKEGKKKKRMEVFSMLNVIERIQTDYPDVEIVSIGEQDFVVQLLDAPMAPKWLETLKVVVMVVVIFLGAAFTIMAFNNDVSVGEVFDRFYQQVMGKENRKYQKSKFFTVWDWQWEFWYFLTISERKKSLQIRHRFRLRCESMNRMSIWRL